MNLPPEVVEQLAAFVPANAVGRLHDRDPELAEAVRVDGRGAVLFSDISGFSPLADRLFASRGVEGTEELTRQLDLRFSGWIERVHACGGEVVKFAGDALLAVFWADGEQRADLVDATWRATACAIGIQRPRSDTGDLHLSQRVRIGAGRVSLARLGGWGGRWEAVLCGDAVQQIGAQRPRLQAGEVGLSEAAWPLCEGFAVGRVLPEGGALITRLRRSPGETPPPLPSAAPGSIVPFIPDHVRGQYQLGAGAFLAEHRPLAVMFVGLPELDPAADRGLELAQRAVQGIQRCLREHDGALDKISLDDKGGSVLAAFGLPPSPAEHRSIAALSAALELEQDLAGLGLRSSIGVATGRTFCGPVGGAGRREYTIIGTAVNRAARLMTGGGAPVCCDAATRDRAGTAIDFETLGRRRLKGLDGPEEVFRPRRLDLRSTGGWQRPVASVAGRQRELERLVAGLDRLADRPHTTVFGPAGIGKTTLVSELLVRVRERGLPAGLVTGSPALRNTPLAAWRPWFEELLELNASAGQPERIALLEERLATGGDRARSLPLLEPLLRLGLPDNEHTAQLAGSNRWAVAVKLMLELAGQGLGGGDGGVLVVEDLQWLDSPSMRLLSEATRRLPGLMVVATCRGRVEEASAEVADHAARGEVLEVGGLEQEAVHALLEARLGRAPAQGVAGWLHSRTGGNPLFCNQLIDSLAVQGALERPADPGGFDAEELDELTLPARVEDAVIGRLDRLSPAQQLVVKAASAAGRRFDLRLLRAALPIERTDAELRADIDAAVEVGLLARDRSGGEDELSFTHGLGLAVAYRTMVGAQRRSIHRSVAEHIAAAQAGRPRVDHALLAHHWSRAGELARAFDAYDAAIDRAVGDGHNRQVVALAGRALELCRQDEAAADAPTLRRARWRQRRAYALNELTDYAGAEREVAAMGRLLGRPVPTSDLGWTGRLLRQALIQILHRLVPSLLVKPWRDRPDEALRLASLGSNTLTSTAYWTAKSAVVFPATALWSLNLAERAGMPAPRSCLATMGTLMGSLRLAGPADRYFERGRAEAERTGDRDMMAVTCLMEGVYGGLFGRWELADRLGQRAIDVAKGLGVDNLVCHALQASAFNLALQGRLTEALERYGEEARIAASHGLGKDEFNAQLRRVALLKRLGRRDEAEEVLARTRQLRSDDSPLADRFQMAALEAWLADGRGELEQALRRVEEALEIIGPMPLADPGSFDPLTQLCDVLLRAVRAASESDRPPLLRQLEHTRTLLGRVAQAFPTMRPGALLVKGRLLRLRGRGRAAVRAFHKALEVAAGLGLDLDVARARLELGLAPQLPEPERRELLAAALTVFEERGVELHAARARDGLE